MLLAKVSDTLNRMANPGFVVYVHNRYKNGLSRNITSDGIDADISVILRRNITHAVARNFKMFNGI